MRPPSGHPALYGEGHQKNDPRAPVVTGKSPHSVLVGSAPQLSVAVCPPVMPALATYLW